jgi:hypothetical protein
MHLPFRRSTVALLVAIGAVAIVGSAMAAAGKKAISCDARTGKTVLEDSAARVYELHGLDYACARPSGRVHLLFHPATAAQPEAASNIELAGRYTVWSEVDNPPTDNVSVLDIATGAYRTADTLILGQHGSVGAFVLNADGTVIVTEDFDHCMGSASSTGCEASSTLRESSTHGTSVLAQDTNSSESPAPAATIPITSLGLSSDGTTAYWVDNGKYEGASIP